MATTHPETAGESIASTTTDGSAAVDETVRLPATEAVRELGRLAADATRILRGDRATVRRCRPDGDWVRDEVTAGRETWARTTAGGHTVRVQLWSVGPTRGWHVVCQHPDGTSSTLTNRPRRRAAAARLAEDVMADIADVPDCNRTRDLAA